MKRVVGSTLVVWRRLYPTDGKYSRRCLRPLQRSSGVIVGRTDSDVVHGRQVTHNPTIYKCYASHIQQRGWGNISSRDHLRPVNVTQREDVDRYNAYLTWMQDYRVDELLAEAAAFQENEVAAVGPSYAIGRVNAQDDMEEFGLTEPASVGNDFQAIMEEDFEVLDEGSSMDGTNSADEDTDPVHDSDASFVATSDSNETSDEDEDEDEEGDKENESDSVSSEIDRNRPLFSSSSLFAPLDSLLIAEPLHQWSPFDIPFVQVAAERSARNDPRP
ncbi:hypothetical protein K470DRAFT_263940 [Piedraia hortae CBS 480.64]|uniref:Uncharacterized protein n=1 Tax=Piedraia hortae CBS 480.64 TaxID=1314780 RepID=A0A6A7C264_9PEZI|nr:hypothetical protein K470DRAFT_263940 [Piedraia hortae CBS 480.64]